MAVATRESRRRLLLALLAEHDIHSQSDAVALLAEHGIEATQATVSRDLDDLGAVKVRGPDGQLVYRVAVDPGPAAARRRLPAVLRQFVTRIDASGNLAVLRTPPAGAGPVASALDLAELPDVLATVAGDDTVLVVAQDGVPGADVARGLRALLDGDEEER